MAPIDLVILAIVIAAVALCVRSIARSGNACSSCASASTCPAHLSGEGECPAARRMLENAEDAAGEGGR